MKKVSIKRVKKIKKPISLKKKILAGLGVASALGGGAVNVVNKPQTPIVANQNNQKDSTSSKIKSKLVELFGVPKAKADDSDDESQYVYWTSHTSGNETSTCNGAYVTGGQGGGGGGSWSSFNQFGANSNQGLAPGSNSGVSNYATGPDGQSTIQTGNINTSLTSIANTMNIPTGSSGNNNSQSGSGEVDEEGEFTGIGNEEYDDEGSGEGAPNPNPPRLNFTPPDFSQQTQNIINNMGGGWSAPSYDAQIQANWQRELERAIQVGAQVSGDGSIISYVGIDGELHSFSFNEFKNGSVLGDYGDQSNLANLTANPTDLGNITGGDVDSNGQPINQKVDNVGDEKDESNNSEETDSNNLGVTTEDIFDENGRPLNDPTGGQNQQTNWSVSNPGVLVGQVADGSQIFRTQDGRLVDSAGNLYFESVQGNTSQFLPISQVNNSVNAGIENHDGDIFTTPNGVNYYYVSQTNEWVNNDGSKIDPTNYQDPELNTPPAGTETGWTPNSNSLSQGTSVLGSQSDYTPRFTYQQVGVSANGTPIFGYFENGNRVDDRTYVQGAGEMSNGFVPNTLQTVNTQGDYGPSVDNNQPIQINYYTPQNSQSADILSLNNLGSPINIPNTQTSNSQTTTETAYIEGFGFGNLVQNGNGVVVFTSPTGQTVTMDNATLNLLTAAGQDTLVNNNQEVSNSFIQTSNPVIDQNTENPEYTNLGYGYFSKDGVIYKQENGKFVKAENQQAVNQQTTQLLPNYSSTQFNHSGFEELGYGYYLKDGQIYWEDENGDMVIAPNTNSAALQNSLATPSISQPQEGQMRYNGSNFEKYSNGIWTEFENKIALTEINSAPLDKIKFTDIEINDPILGTFKLTTTDGVNYFDQNGNKAFSYTEQGKIENINAKISSLASDAKTTAVTAANQIKATTQKISEKLGGFSILGSKEKKTSLPVSDIIKGKDGTWTKRVVVNGQVVNVDNTGDAWDDMGNRVQLTGEQFAQVSAANKVNSAPFNFDLTYEKSDKIIDTGIKIAKVGSFLLGPVSGIGTNFLIKNLSSGQQQSFETWLKTPGDGVMNYTYKNANGQVIIASMTKSQYLAFVTSPAILP